MPRKLNITLDEAELNLLAKILAGGTPEKDEEPEIPRIGSKLQEQIHAVYDCYIDNPFEKNKRQAFVWAFCEIYGIGDPICDVIDAILPANVEYLELGLFLATWVKMCDQYVEEDKRITPLLPGEALRACASAINVSLRSRAFQIGSPHGPRYDSLGMVLSSIAGLLFRLASYHGCERAPIIPWGSGTPGGDTPYSIPS